MPPELRAGSVALRHADSSSIVAQWHLRPADRAVDLAVFHLLYGAFFAACATTSGLLFDVVWQRIRRHRVMPAASAPGVFSPLLAGAALFHAGFWILFVDYGLTYDELPFVAHGFWPMAGWLALRALGVIVLVAMATVVTAAAGRWLLGRRRLLAATVAAFAVSVAAHLVVTLLPAPPPPPAAASQSVQANLAAGQPRWHVAVVSVDGADWRVADPLIAAGRLPNLARMVSEGSRAALTTIPDSNSAVIWASIYSGRTPAAHGVADFYTVHGPGLGAAGLFPVHRTYFKELAAAIGRWGVFRLATVDRRTTKVPLMWEIADQAGLSIGLVDGYFYSYPALTPRQPDSYVFAYGLDAFAQLSVDLDGTPTDRSTLAQYVQPLDAFPIAKPFLRLPDWEWQSHTLLAALAARPQPRLTSLYTHQPDTVQHQTWRGMEPQWYWHVSAHTRAELGPRFRLSTRASTVSSAICGADWPTTPC